jgi:hypothetical protein
MTLHGHKVYDKNIVNDCQTLRHLASGWEPTSSRDRNLEYLCDNATFSWQALIVDCTDGYFCVKSTYTPCHYKKGRNDGTCVVMQGLKVGSSAINREIMLRINARDAVAECRALGCSWQVLKAAGFTAAQLVSKGCNLENLVALGFELGHLLLAIDLNEALVQGINIGSVTVVSSMCYPSMMLMCADAHTMNNRLLALRFNTCNCSAHHLAHHLTFTFLQRDGDFYYMTAHAFKVDEQTSNKSGDDAVDIAPGWEVAPGDDTNAHRVCGAHAWQAYCLVFADGGYCCSASQSASKGILMCILLTTVLVTSQRRGIPKK